MSIPVSRRTRAALLLSCWFFQAAPARADDGQAADGVTVYAKHDFADAQGPWQATHGARLALADNGTADNALGVICRNRWSGASLPVQVEHSRGLKIALHMKATADLESVGLNVFDQRAGDNTTTLGPRFLSVGHWTPILYHLDRFRYNSSASTPVRPNANYNNVQFVGPAQASQGTAFSIDNFVFYRGSDATPPSRVEGLTAASRADGVQLAWRPASDNVAPMLYVVSRAEGDAPFQKIAETVSAAFVDVTAGQASYRYRVLAVDFEENVGPWSDAVAVPSASVAPQEQITREQADRKAYATRIRRIHARGRGHVHRGHGTLFGDSLTGATVYPRHCQSALLTLTVDNRGFAGQRTSFGRRKIDEILQQQKPEFVFILFGTNNAKSPTDIPAAMADLQAIVAACERRGSVAILGTIPPRGFRDSRSLPEAHFNRRLVALCRRLKVPTAYIFESIQSAGPRQQFISRDGVHWTSAGMSVAAKAWGRTLQQVRFALRDRPDGAGPEVDLAARSAHDDRRIATAGDPSSQNQDPADGRPVATSSDTNPAARAEAEKPPAAQHKCPVCGFSPPRTRFSETVANMPSLERAVQNARPDTTIWLRPGLYQLNRTLNLQTPRVVLRSLDGDPTKVFIVGQGVDEQAVGVALSIGASDITIDGVSVGYVGFHGVQVRGENGVRNAVLHNLHVFDTGQQLLKGSVDPKNGRHSHDCVVACSLFDYEKGAPGSYTNGVDVLGGRGWHVRDNVFRTIRGPLKTGGGAGPAILFWHNSRDTIVERNVIGNCYRGIALGLVPSSSRPLPPGETYCDHEGGVIRNNIIWNLNAWADEGIEANAARDVKIEHNTVFVTGRMPWSISARFPATNALVRNNLCNRKIMLRDGGSVIQQGNVTDAGPEWFVNVEQPDLRLNGKQRRAIDVGVPIEDLSQDFRLRPRTIGKASDAGAFEFDPKDLQK